MNRGPSPGRAGTDFVVKAEAAWAPAPDWVVELALHASRFGQREAGTRIGYSGSTVSMVINNKAGALDLGRIEEAVRGALMGLTVDCPVLGEIGRERCLQEQAEPYRATSAYRARLYHTCRNGCPHARLKGGSHE